MPNGAPYSFGDDQPKTNPWQDDFLEFRPFAENLFKIVANMRAANGYLIGLQGEWGSGKSTVLNFVNAYIEKHNQEAQSDIERITLVDFRPWIVSGHQDLIAAFFKVMSEALAIRRSWWKRQLGRALRVFKSTTDPRLQQSQLLSTRVAAQHPRQ